MEKAANLWRSTLDRYAMPILGNLPVDQIGRDDVLRALTPIWTAKPETERKVRQRVRATLAWAEAHGFADRNMAGEAIDGAFPTMPAVASNLRALPHGETPRQVRRGPRDSTLAELMQGYMETSP